MLAIAIQTAGPNGLKFLEEPVSTSGVGKAKKDFIKQIDFFLSKFFFFFTSNAKHFSYYEVLGVIIIMK